MHHLTYARVGQERLEDLIHLCRRHHALAHVMTLCCWRCDEPIAGEDEDWALSLVDDALEECGEEEALVCATDALATWFGGEFSGLCDYCSHVMESD